MSHICISCIALLIGICEGGGVLLIFSRVSARCRFHESLNWARLVQGAECRVFRCKYLQELNKKVFRSESGYQEELSVGCLGAIKCKYLQDLNKKVFRSESCYQKS
jgi:hypothetical protein